MYKLPNNNINNNAIQNVPSFCDDISQHSVIDRCIGCVRLN